MSPLVHFVVKFVCLKYPYYIHHSAIRLTLIINYTPENWWHDHRNPRLTHAHGNRKPAHQKSQCSTTRQILKTSHERKAPECPVQHNLLCMGLCSQTARDCWHGLQIPHILIRSNANELRTTNKLDPQTGHPKIHSTQSIHCHCPSAGQHCTPPEAMWSHVRETKTTPVAQGETTQYWA